MSYVKSDGTYVYTVPFPPIGPQTVTANGNGPSTEEGGRSELRDLILTVTAASGTTPTLNVVVQCSADNVTWYPNGDTQFTQMTGAGTQQLSFGGLDRFVRVAWTVGGTTPSFTFSVTGGELV